MTKPDFRAILKSRKEKERKHKMTKYTIDGFRFHEEYTKEADARERFAKVKDSFRYCELKQVTETASGYYAKSLEVHCDR